MVSYSSFQHGSTVLLMILQLLVGLALLALAILCRQIMQAKFCWLLKLIYSQLCSYFLTDRFLCTIASQLVATQHLLHCPHTSVSTKQALAANLQTTLILVCTHVLSWFNSYTIITHSGDLSSSSLRRVVLDHLLISLLFVVLTLNFPCCVQLLALLKAWNDYMIEFLCMDILDSKACNIEFRYLCSTVLQYCLRFSHCHINISFLAVILLI